MNFLFYLYKFMHKMRGTNGRIFPQTESDFEHLFVIDFCSMDTLKGIHELIIC